jgi:hypothetical protein
MKGTVQLSLLPFRYASLMERASQKEDLLLPTQK